MQHNHIVWQDVSTSPVITRLLARNRIYKAIPLFLLYRQGTLHIFPDEMVVGSDPQEIRQILAYMA
jgi:hypothetical protein